MWHLQRPSRGTLRWYKILTLEKLCDRIEKSDLDEAIKNMLVMPGRARFKVLKKLLLSSPESLYGINARLERKLEHKGLWTEENKEKLLNAFDYAGVLSRNKKNSYALTGKIGRNTCTYCNRIYNHTITDDSGGVARPELDHWLDKAEHPLLSLSIYNLIPSCHICNSTIKHMVHFEYGKHVHPYDKDGIKFSFGYKCGTGGKWEVKLKNCKGKEAETAKELKTLQLYKPHGMMEVKDLLDFATDNTKEYLEELCQYVMHKGKKTLSWDEAYRIIFGTEREEERYLDRPLSKMKHDVLFQLKKNKGIKIIN